MNMDNSVSFTVWVTVSGWKSTRCPDFPQKQEPLSKAARSSLWNRDFTTLNGAEYALKTSYIFPLKEKLSA